MFPCAPTARNISLFDLYKLMLALSCAPIDTEHPNYLVIDLGDIYEDMARMSIQDFAFWIAQIQRNLKISPQDLSPELMTRANSKGKILVKKKLLCQVRDALQEIGIYV